MATSWVIIEPMERPATTTGGSHTASINSAQSRAMSRIDHGGGSIMPVSPTPRGSWVVLRKSEKPSTCQRISRPRWSPPGIQTMSGPAPVCS
jgi:hypothetical protein